MTHLRLATPEPHDAACIQRLKLDGSVTVVATEGDGIAFVAPNDLAFGPDRRLYFTDSGDSDHVNPMTILPEEHIPDRFATAVDGRIFVATVTSGGITVLSPEGELVDHVAVRAEPTNCAFDGSTLVVTAYTPANEPDSGHLLSFETDTTGLPLLAGRLARWSPCATPPSRTGDDSFSRSRKSIPSRFARSGLSSTS